MEEGKKMFSIFAARMFEQRVLQAYREKVAQERQQQLLRELEDEDKITKEREAKKQSQNQKKKDKKRFVTFASPCMRVLIVQNLYLQSAEACQGGGTCRESCREGCRGSRAQGQAGCTRGGEPKTKGRGACKERSATEGAGRRATAQRGGAAQGGGGQAQGGRG